MFLTKEEAEHAETYKTPAGDGRGPFPLAVGKLSGKKPIRPRQGTEEVANRICSNDES